MMGLLEEQLKGKQIPEARAVPEAPTSPAGLLPMEAPKHWTEEAMDRDGKAKFFGKMLLGGFTGMTPFLFPEMIGSKARYAAELETYQDQLATQRLAEGLGSVDASNLTPTDVALAHSASPDLGEYYADQYAAQQNSGGGDEAIADHFGYSPYQWSQLSPETKRDMRDRYAFSNGGTGAFDYRLEAEGKSPEQLQAAKEGETYGSARGQQFGDDRKMITSVRGTVQAADQNLEALSGVKALLEDPDNSDLTGWQRSIRDMIRMNTREDGTLDAEMATGVVDLISKATFGALSQSELDLLKGGLMDPAKSVDYNLGTIDKAMERVENDKKLAIGAAQGAARRYKGWDGQDDYDQLFEDDWLYQNIGEGSRVPSIPAFGNREEVTFSDYVEYRKSQRGPFDPPLSRDELIIGFKELRDESEAEYNAMIEKQEADRESAERARLGLDRPWPTVKQ